MAHRTLSELQAGLEGVRGSPIGAGTVELVVRRPAPGEREELTHADLHLVEGLVGDCWRTRGARDTPDGGPHPFRQLTLMNSRAAQLVAGTTERWALAGDQLFVDLDLSHEQVPAGALLLLGTAIVEITEAPHNGCAKFTDRFGADATRLVNSPEGKARRLRGANARVVQAGSCAKGDPIVVVDGAGQPASS